MGHRRRPAALGAPFPGQGAAHRRGTSNQIDFQRPAGVPLRSHSARGWIIRGRQDGSILGRFGPAVFGPAIQKFPCLARFFLRRQMWDGANLRTAARAQQPAVVRSHFRRHIRLTLRAPHADISVRKSSKPRHSKIWKLRRTSEKRGSLRDNETKNSQVGTGGLCGSPTFLQDRIFSAFAADNPGELARDSAVLQENQANWNFPPLASGQGTG